MWMGGANLSYADDASDKLRKAADVFEILEDEDDHRSEKRGKAHGHHKNKHKKYKAIQAQYMN